MGMTFRNMRSLLGVVAPYSTIPRTLAALRNMRGLGELGEEETCPGSTGRGQVFDHSWGRRPRFQTAQWIGEVGLPLSPPL